MFTALQPEDLDPIIAPLQEEIQQLKTQMAFVLIILNGFQYLTREQTLKILEVSDDKLKKMGVRGELEYKKGRRKIEYSFASVFNYLVTKKRFKPDAILERYASLNIKLSQSAK